ncbi:FeoA family protein [Pleurocapsa sp. PCC 7319]|uniref:FeoA family protein n=1 Tax=Pleurocapsa sp. PCC 7319 TaxID=118161 RepID=UPI000347DD92|nr:FeoA family protein [Pleurocapsa sp. PCC 7319]
MKITTSIRELSLGSVAIVAGYSLVYGGYVGRLMSKGLIPGTPFILLNLSLAEGAVQIMLQEKIITLSKPEANALCIEDLAEDD